jgi:hypothetical protein
MLREERKIEEQKERRKTKTKCTSTREKKINGDGDGRKQFGHNGVCIRGEPTDRRRWARNTNTAITCSAWDLGMLPSAEEWDCQMQKILHGIRNWS